MGSLIIVFPKLEDAQKIRDVCVRHGFEVAVVLQYCRRGSV